jgi:hypothetical protein
MITYQRKQHANQIDPDAYPESSSHVALSLIKPFETAENAKSDMPQCSTT